MDTVLPTFLDPASTVAAWIIIVGMAFVTALTRFAGYWLVGKKELNADIKNLLSAVPPAVLTAIVAPAIVTGTIAEWVAALVTIALAWRFSTLTAIAGGVLSVVVLRALLS